jgi:transcriptional regulator with PAS, ATPase and Fis domain
MKDIYPIFFSNSLKMIKIKIIIDEIAKTDITVLIKGESGTGKELVAQAIHLNSHRRENPFIKVNCAAIPKGLLESELFGFEKGAFTGAHLRKPGKFELANGGTLLLNDIGETDISIQAKLLQVLQDGEFSRLGGEDDIKVNTRLITTTKDHLEQSIINGHFREDLFFRINVITITVPPLRERKDQILPLSEYFLDSYRKKYERPIYSLSSKMINSFQEYHWPGNIRELENVIKRIILLGEEKITFQDLNQKIWTNGNGPELFDNNFPIASRETGILGLKEVGKRAAETAERETIQDALQETHWNRKEAAKLLHVSYKALLYKIQKYRINEWSGRKRNLEANPVRKSSTF